MSTQPAPNPERIFATLTAYQTSAGLAAAIQLKLFTHVAAGAGTLAELARATGAPERGLRALVTLLVTNEFLVQRGARLENTPEAALFLDERSPAYMGSVTEFLNSPGLARCFDDVLGAVRRGGTVEKDGGTVSAENPVWVEFARAMQPMARFLGPGMADVLCRGGVPRRVLDIAAGHGLYGIEIARRAPGTELVAQDWPGVLAVARANAEAAGLAARFRTLPGSAFDVDLGRGHDAILVTNFLHHFERERNVAFLARCRAALAPGGRVAVLEFRLEDDRLTPPQSASFDLVMLATTPRGEAYTLSEYAAMFTAAGLARPESHPLAGSSHVVLVAGER